jgi:hypothetical protein
MSENPIGLAEAIQKVRTELDQARLGREGKELQFRLDEVSLEFQVEVTREGGAEGGINIWVVSFGAKGGVRNTGTHTVTVSMVPQIKSGGEWVDVHVAQDVTARPTLPDSDRP